jgi:hypothetical protein
MKFIKNLSWHSWCEISLYKSENKFFVRKTAWKESYNMRLQAQLDKQKSFKSNIFYAPEIYGQWYIWDIFYFDMQYLNCQTLASYMQSITVKEISSLVEKAIETLDIKWEEYLENTNEIFQKKLKSLRNSFNDITWIENEALILLENFDFSIIPHSRCHWDLTLENILITQDKKIYLIDFLDSFFDSWMIDAAKLLQDLEIGWSYRHEEMNWTLSLRLTIAKQALLESISELEDWKNKISYIYHILLLNILRIVPYTKDDITKNFLQDALKKVINILDSNNL